MLNKIHISFCPIKWRLSKCFRKKTSAIIARVTLKEIIVIISLIDQEYDSFFFFNWQKRFLKLIIRYLIRSYYNWVFLVIMSIYFIIFMITKTSHFSSIRFVTQNKKVRQEWNLTPLLFCVYISNLINAIYKTKIGI